MDEMALTSRLKKSRGSKAVLWGVTSLQGVVSLFKKTLFLVHVVVFPFDNYLGLLSFSLVVSYGASHTFWLPRVPWGYLPGEAKQGGN